MSAGAAAVPGAQVADLDASIASILEGVGGATQTTEPVTDQSLDTGQSVDLPADATEAQATEAATEPVEAEAVAEAEEVTPEEQAEEAKAEEAARTGQPLTRRQRESVTVKWARSAMEKLNGSAFTGKLDPDLLPSVDDLAAGQEAFVVQRQMAADFDAGTPEAHERFLAHWTQQNPEAMKSFARNLLPALAKANPDAAAALHSNSVNHFVHGLYGQAERIADPELKASMIAAAQVCEWWVTGGPNGGRFRSMPMAATDGQQQQVDDPTRQILADLQRRAQTAEQALRMTRQQQQGQIFTQQQQAMNGELEQITTTVEKPILEQLKKAYEGQPKIYEAAARSFRQDLDAATRNNQYQYQLYDVAYKRAVQTGDPQAITEAKTRWSYLAKSAISSLQPQYLRQSKQVVSQASQARHEQLRQASEHRVPAPNGGGSSPRATGGVDLSKIAPGDQDGLISAILGR